MVKGTVLSPQTASRLKNLLDKNGGGNGNVHGGGGTRQTIHVLVTGEPDEERKYACTPTAYKPDVGSWEEYGEAECFVYEANDLDLRVGDRYMAVRYGITSDEQWIFVADNMYPLVKCHLEYKQDPDDHDKWKLDVTPESLAGCGLALQVDGTCDKLKVDPAQIVGCGLKVQEDNSDDPSDSSDSFGTATGCRIDVDAEQLAGCGLKAVDASDGGCQLEIDMDEVTGPTFTAITSIGGDGCGISYTVTTYTVKTNECGVFIGLETGEGVTSTVSLDACCSCDSDSDSSSDSSSSDEDCAGWYCCEATGAVQYVADCEEFAALADCGGEVPTGCCDPAPPSPLTVTVTGDCGSHTFPITYSGGTWYGYTGETFGCGTGVGCGVTLTCDGETYSIGGVASFCGPTSASGLTPTSCSPFSLSWSGAETGLCGGTLSVTITE